MNQTLVKGHFKVDFTFLPEDNTYCVTQYQFLPGHLNYVPYSAKVVSAKDGMNLMRRLARENYGILRR